LFVEKPHSSHRSACGIKSRPCLVTLATKKTAQSHEEDEESASSLSRLGCSPLLAARLERALRLGGARALERPELLVSVRVRVRVLVLGSGLGLGLV